MAVALEEREGKENMTGTPKDELCAGAAVAMTTDSTVDREHQQRVSVCVRASVFVMSLEAEALTGRVQDHGRSVTCAEGAERNTRATQSHSNSETAKLETQ